MVKGKKKNRPPEFTTVGRGCPDEGLTARGLPTSCVGPPLRVTFASTRLERLATARSTGLDPQTV